MKDDKISFEMLTLTVVKHHKVLHISFPIQWRELTCKCLEIFYEWIKMRELPNINNSNTFKRSEYIQWMACLRHLFCWASILLSIKGVANSWSCWRWARTAARLAILWWRFLCRHTICKYSIDRTRYRQNFSTKIIFLQFLK